MSSSSDRRWSSVSIAVGLLLAVGVYYAYRHTEAPEAVVTPDNLQEYVFRASMRKVYRTGKANVSRAEKTGTIPKFAGNSDKDDFFASISQYLIIEFLRTLTPAQIEKIHGKKGHLEYSALTSEQKKLVELRDKYKRVRMGTTRPRDPDRYNAAYAQFRAWDNSRPSLVWYFPRPDGLVGMSGSSVQVDW